MPRTIDDLWALLYDAGYEFDVAHEYRGDPARYYTFIKPPKMIVIRSINRMVEDAMFEKLKEQVSHETEEETGADR